MSELAEDITANQAVIRLDEPLPAGKRHFHLDDEVVEVTGLVREDRRHAPDGTLVNIRRGEFETTPASHSNGAVLTALYPDAISPDGGEQRIRIFKHSFAHDTADITTSGHDLWTPATEQVILDVWMRVTTAWDSDVAEAILKSRNNDDQLIPNQRGGLWWDLKLAESQAGDYGRIASTNNQQSHVASAAVMSPGNAAGESWVRGTRWFPAHVLVETPIYVEVYIEGTATAGAAEFWFLIAEPAD